MGAPFEKSTGQYTDIFAFEPLSVSGSVVALTAATFAPSDGTNAIAAHVSVEGGQVRWRADGTDPTTSVGTLLGDGDETTVWGSRDIISIRFIATAGGVTLNVHYAR